MHCSTHDSHAEALNSGWVYNSHQLPQIKILVCMTQILLCKSPVSPEWANGPSITHIPITNMMCIGSTVDPAPLPGPFDPSQPQDTSGDCRPLRNACQKCNNSNHAKQAGLCVHAGVVAFQARVRYRRTTSKAKGNALKKQKSI